MKNLFLVALAALSIGLVACEEIAEPEVLKIIEDSQPSAVNPAKGFYVANEDWYGHDEGTVNYFERSTSSYDVVYRAYRAANPNEKLGTTTQFGTTWGNYIYLVSKQGNRLVVTDANTLKKKALFTEIGGDGRSFVGVDDKLGYIGHSKGIRKFDITNLQLGDPVPGITDQIGALCYAEGRVFALAAKKVYVIDVVTNQVEKTVSGDFNTLTRSKDGIIWIATTNNFIKMNPKTLVEETMAYPGGVKVGSPWFAWNAGSLCAGTQTNVLYWAKGSSWSSTGIVKYDIDKQEFKDNFYSLGKHENVQLNFYGAGFRVDPITDCVVATVARGYENYNWVYILNPDGTLEKEVEVKGGTENVENGYYWFPAVPFFEDANKPEILTNMIHLASGEAKTIDLNQKIVDADNTSASIIRTVEFVDNSLIDHAFENGILTVSSKGATGKTQCTITAISNGVRVEKQIPIILD